LTQIAHSEKVFFMRIFLSILIFFNVFTQSNAEGIKDLTIEGISVGDSALTYFSENQIKNNIWDYYKDKKFTPVQMTDFPFYETYEAIDFDYKKDDPKYTIYSLSGVLSYKDKNIEDCYKKMDKIDKELLSVLTNFNRENKATFKHQVDPSGESTFTDIYYESEKGTVTITCYDFSKEQEKKGSADFLSVTIALNEWVAFIRSNPYN